MSILIGGIDPAKEIVDLNIRIGTLERLLNIALTKGDIKLTQAEIDNAREESVKHVIGQYPSLGLELKK